MHFTIRHSIEVTGEPLGYLDGDCPHCNLKQTLVRRRLLGRINSIPIRAGEALECPACAKYSRNEGLVSRLFGVATLIPFAAVLLPAIGTGVYFLVSMVGSEFSMGFAAIGLILVLVPGYAEYRTISAIARLLRTRKLLPLDGLYTQI